MPCTLFEVIVLHISTMEHWNILGHNNFRSGGRSEFICINLFTFYTISLGSAQQTK